MANQDGSTPRPLSPYARPIYPDAPLLVTILIDQSSSMSNWFGDATSRKDQIVADITNDYIEMLVRLCSRPGGVFRENYHISVIGYSGPEGVAPTLDYPFGVPIRRSSELDALADQETRETDDGVRRFPVWVRPRAEARTPMRAALRAVRDELKQWIEIRQNSHPPIVFHITDGESTDGDPRDVAAEIQELDGGPLLFNCHISSTNQHELILPAERPDSAKYGPAAAALWECSSALPQPMLNNLISRTGQTFPYGTRGYMFNLTKADWIRHLLKGTTPRPRS